MALKLESLSMSGGRHRNDRNRRMFAALDRSKTRGVWVDTAPLSSAYGVVQEHIGASL